jgi:hypothetical protein
MHQLFDLVLNPSTAPHPQPSFRATMPNQTEEEVIFKAIAINALSLTNRPQAATVLSQNYQNSHDIRQAIIRMGDVAVPELSKLIERGVSGAIDDLMVIGTPDAARAMITFLWHSDSDVTGKIAWCVATLLRQPEIESTLQEIRLSPEQKSSGQWDWIWIPFTTSQNLDFLNIIGRTTDLLIKHARQKEIDNSIEPDPRIVIPICAFSKELAKCLPKMLSNDAEFLLDSGEFYVNFPREELLKETLEDVLDSMAANEPHLTYLLKTLSLEVQLDLIGRLVNRKKPSHQDWINIFQRVKFSFGESCQYYLILLITLVTSGVAIAESIYLPFRFPSISINWIISLPAVITILTWNFILIGKGLNLFFEIGVFGWLFFERKINIFRHKINIFRHTLNMKNEQKSEDSLMVIGLTYGAIFLAIPLFI